MKKNDGENKKYNTLSQWTDLTIVFQTQQKI